MAPVSSVAAFIACYGDAADPVAAEILATLDADERAVVARHRHPAATSSTQPEGWSVARVQHMQLLAFAHLRRALQRRGLWLP